MPAFLSSLPIIGSSANAAAIIIGGAIGLLAGQRFEKRVQKTVMQALSLCTIMIGLQMALKAEKILVLVLSMAIGGLCGEVLNLEKRMEKAAGALRRFVKTDADRFLTAFVTTSLLFCVGSMAIVGSIEEGIRGNTSILLTKALLDGTTSIVFAAALGPGVLLSAVPVLIYQGAIALGAAHFAGFFTAPVVNALSATGGLMIVAIGLNVLELVNIPLGNFLPALPLAAILALWL